MTDTKLDEAIALARRIVDFPDDTERQPNHAGLLARALLDATAPGAQYRAGMEAALKLIGVCSHDGGFDRELGPVGCDMGDGCMCLGNWSAIRAAIAALPASPEPAPVAMPELRWEDGPDGDRLCFLGPFHVGAIIPYLTGGWRGYLTFGMAFGGADTGFQPTESEARTAVEAAVRERLGSPK